MCIIVYKPAGSVVTEETFNNCWNNNKDGAGFIYKDDDGGLHLQKGFMTFADFYSAYLPFEDKEMLVHFRIKTHGKIDAENTHPFWIKEDEMAFAHNGILDISMDKDLTRSDTWHFNEGVLKPFVALVGTKGLDTFWIRYLISGAIGNSKLVFMRKGNKSTWIFGKDKGIEVGDIWYSNSSFKNWNSKSNVVTTTYHTEPRTPDTPLKISPYTFKQLEIGDVVELRYDVEGQGKKGDFGIIRGVSEKSKQDWIVEIWTETDNYEVGQEFEIPYYRLSLVD